MVVLNDNARNSTTVSRVFDHIDRGSPFTDNWASFYGPVAESPDPVGICTREFTCELGQRYVGPVEILPVDFDEFKQGYD
jgi:hypothetical protein